MFFFASEGNLVVISFESLVCENEDLGDNLVALIESKDTAALNELLHQLRTESGAEFKGKKLEKNAKKVSIKGKSAVKVRLVKQE